MTARRVTSSSSAMSSSPSQESNFKVKDETTNATSSSSSSKIKSCAECRRLKLKCVRDPSGEWPCQQCQRRKCPQICPSLTSTTSARAGNERLLRFYRNRISELEAKLEQAQKQLQLEPLSGQSSSADTRMRSASVATNTTSFDDDRTAASSSSFGMHRDSESSLTGQSSTPARTQHTSPSSRRHLRLSSSHVRDAGNPEMGYIASNSSGGTAYFGRAAGDLYTAELFQNKSEANSGRNSPSIPDQLNIFGTARETTTQVLASLIPLNAEALLASYHEGVAWMYDPIDIAVLQEILSETRDKGVDQIHPHRLACLFLALSMGSMFNSGPSLTKALAEERAHRAWFSAALSSLSSNWHTNFLANPSPEAASALHMLTTYMLTSGDPKLAQAAWNTLGLGVRLAQSMGLSMDQHKWGLSELEARRRAKLFWELVVYDRLQALNFGRPYMNHVASIECSPPVPYPSSGLGPQYDVMVFHGIKYKLCGFLERIVDLLSGPVLPPHSVAMDLDQEIRFFEAQIPTYLLLDRPLAADISAYLSEAQISHILSQRHMICMMIHKALLFLHRPWFGRTLFKGGEPLLSEFAPSFAAAVSSARKHTQLYESLLDGLPRALTWWFFTFHAFSASVIQAFVLLRAPTSMLANDVQADFRLTYDLLSRASKISKLAAKALPTLDRMKNAIRSSAGGEEARTGNESAASAADSAQEVFETATSILGLSRWQPGNSTEYHHRGTDLPSPQLLQQPPNESRFDHAACSPPHGWDENLMSNMDTDIGAGAGASGNADAAVDLSSNLLGILTSDLLPEEYQVPAEWTYHDPLLQSVLFWHPASNMPDDSLGGVPDVGGPAQR